MAQERSVSAVAVIVGAEDSREVVAVPEGHGTTRGELEKRTWSSHLKMRWVLASSSMPYS